MPFKGMLYGLLWLSNLVGFAKVRLQKVQQATLRRIRQRPDKGALWSGILINLVLLWGFKHLPGAITAPPSPLPQRLSDPALPVRESFWTFQAKYLFDFMPLYVLALLFGSVATLIQMQHFTVYVE